VVHDWLCWCTAVLASGSLLLSSVVLTCGPRTPGGRRRLLRGSATVQEIK
jgi:hypothetical protein